METSFAASPDFQSRALASVSTARSLRPVSARFVSAAAVLLCLGTLSGAAMQISAQQPQTAAQTPGHPAHTPKRAEREEIEELEQQLQKAQLSGDVGTMDKLLSEDYLGVNANGELVTKAQQLDHMRSRALVITRVQPSDVKIKLIGPTAIVTSEVQLEGTLDGVALRGRYRYTRIYQRVPGDSWKVTSFEATRIVRPNG